MTGKPIIYSGPMVRALLEGRKTMDRRVLKNVPPQPETNCHPSHQQKHPAPYLDAYCSKRPSPQNPRGMGEFWNWWQADDRACLPQFKVGYMPGDLLWVREAWAQSTNHRGPIYRADGESLIRWRPSIHMPRWASRLTLRVTGVKVERLQDISEDDARAEGLSWVAPTYGVPGLAGSWQGSSVAAFASLWDSIHGPGSWEANPWVAAISFDVIKSNIDQVKP